MTIQILAIGSLPQTPILDSVSAVLTPVLNDRGLAGVTELDRKWPMGGLPGDT